MKPVVSVNIVTFNGEKYIKDCLNSVFGQSYRKVEVLVIDNNSEDKTKEILEEISGSKNSKIPKIKKIFNQTNLGFSKAHNEGIKRSKGEYILCLNQDVVLDKNFLEESVFVLEKDKKIGALQGKLLRKEEPDRIDSAGLVIFKNRRVINRAQGEKDEGGFDKEEEVFGVDGAAPVYRREALEDAKIKDEYFDEDFFCYKEDVDLSWRMRLFGWKCFYEPQAIGWHWRGAGERATKEIIKILKERKKLSLFAKTLSFRNQRLMQIKNELPLLFLRNFPQILIKEICSWLYVIFFEKYGLRSVGKLLEKIPAALRKRRIIMERKRASVGEMQKWFR